MFAVSLRTLFHKVWPPPHCRHGKRRSWSPRRYRPRLRMLETRLTPSIDTWTGANHAVDNNWSDGLNWSLLAPPGVNDTVDFTNNASVQSFTSNVDAAFANSIAAITIDGIWDGTINLNNALSVTGSLELGSGTLNTGGGLTIGGSASDWVGGQINLGTNGFTNNGVLQVDTSARDLVLNATGTLLNNGALQEVGTNTLYLENGAVLANAAEAVFNFANNANVSHSGGGALSNYGTIEKTGGAGTSTISSFWASTGGVIDSESGVLDLDSNGATINGGTNGAALEAGVGGSTSAAIDLTGGQAVTYSGSFTGSGSGTVYLKSGTLVVPSAGVSFNMPAGMLQWSNGVIDVGSGGTFTNAAGSFLHADASSANLNITGNNNNPGGGLRNLGTMLLSGGNNLILGYSAVFTNAAGGTLNITSDASITLVNNGSLINAGTLKKTGGTGFTTIACPFSNTGTVQVATGSFTVSGAVTQISSGTLTTGTWVVSGTSRTPANLAITSASFSRIGSHAHVTVNGVHSNFLNLSNLASILAGGTLSLLGNQFLTVRGAFTNSGHLTLSAGSIFTANGNFTETSTAALTLHMGKVGTVNSMGTIVSNSGVISLAGSVAVTSTVVPAVASSFTVMDNEGNSPISGNFSGLAEGMTFHVTVGATVMTFQIT